MFRSTLSFWRRLVGAEPPLPELLPPRSPASVSPAERRQWVRYETEMPGNVKLATNRDGAKLKATVRNLSEGGAKLSVDRPFELGQVLSIELPVEEGNACTMVACILRVTPEVDGTWTLGCSFSSDIDSNAGELRRLLAKLATTAPVESYDQRSRPRRPCSMGAVYRMVGNVEDRRRHTAEVLDISAGGISMAVPSPLETGALLNIDLIDKSGKTSRTILACVVHTTQRAGDGGALTVGCNFIRELSDDELDSLR
jgi:c-di-GMP-binding flagellar brake protein YcgR